MAILRIRDENGNIQEILAIRGEPGKDGYTPQKGVDYFDGVDGKDGKDGADGNDGAAGVGIAKVEKTAANGNVDTYTITLTDGKTYTFTVTNGNSGSDGADGANGKDGVTPQLRINENTNMWEVSYDNGKTWTSLDVKATGENGKDGLDGKDGAQGAKGADGTSATHQWSGTTLHITSASGTSSANLKGEKGDKGDPGSDATVTEESIAAALGYTPLSLDVYDSDMRIMSNDVERNRNAIADLTEKMDDIADTANTLPDCTEDNNGQFLRVVDGVPAWTTIPRAEDYAF